jgi:hypothetical protein
VDVPSGLPVYQLYSHRWPNQFRFAPDAKTLYVGSRPHNLSGSVPDHWLIAWDTAIGKRRKELTANAWDLSPDGKLLAVAEFHAPPHNLKDDLKDPGPTSFTLRLLDTATWQEVARYEDKNAVLSALCFAPDGKTLALAVADLSVRLWACRGRG